MAKRASFEARLARCDRIDRRNSNPWFIGLWVAVLIMVCIVAAATIARLP